MAPFSVILDTRIHVKALSREKESLSVTVVDEFCSKLTSAVEKKGQHCILLVTKVKNYLSQSNSSLGKMAKNVS